MVAELVQGMFLIGLAFEIAGLVALAGEVLA